MARGRMINTTIALDPEFNGLSLEAQLMFLRTVPHLDRDGLIIGQPAALWATVAPLMPGLMPLMQSIINEWEAAGLVIVIATKIGPVLYCPAFHRNQVGFRYDKEPASRYSLPPEYERTKDGIRQVSDTLPEVCRINDGQVPDDGRPEVEVEVEVEDQQEPTEDDDDNAREATRPETVFDGPAGAVFTAWTENIPGTLTAILKDNILDLFDECGETAMLYGVRAAVEANARNWKYVEVCARNHAAGKEPPGKPVYHRNGKGKGPKPDATPEERRKYQVEIT